jgi:PleD family two-component response regulator
MIGVKSGRDDLLKWADATIYQANELGRNLVRFHELGT